MTITKAKGTFGNSWRGIRTCWILFLVHEWYYWIYLILKAL